MAPQSHRSNPLNGSAPRQRVQVVAPAFMPALQHHVVFPGKTLALHHHERMALGDVDRHLDAALVAFRLDQPVEIGRRDFQRCIALELAHGEVVGDEEDAVAETLLMTADGVRPTMPRSSVVIGENGKPVASPLMPQNSIDLLTRGDQRVTAREHSI